MEVLVDFWGYSVTVQSLKEFKTLEKGGTLEAEILLVQDKEPFNAPTGKILGLRVDFEVREIDISFTPGESDWDGLRKVDVRISPEKYRRVCYSSPVFGTRPRLPTDIKVDG